jgi:TolB protein
MRSIKIGVRWRAVGRSIGLILSLLAVAGTAAATAAPTMRSGQHVAKVPWRRAGPGWSVVEYSAASLSSTKPGRTTFYLVSPKGRKYAFYRTPTATAYPAFELIDWSGDRKRILVSVAGSGGTGRRGVFKQISLVTGTVVSRFTLPGQVFPVEYTRPLGKSLLAFGLGSRALGIDRYSLTGRLQRILASRTLLLGALDSPHGTFVVAGTRTGLDQISNTGAIMRRISIPADLCWAARWWTATTVLARCSGRSPFSTDRLWLVPLDGGAPVALTPALRPHGLFEGYVNAWRIARRLYLQADDAHDTLSIVRQDRDGSRHTITVPGPAGISDAILTAFAGRFLLESNMGGPGGPSSLFWFDPATRTVRFMFRAPPNTYGAVGAIAYGYWNE